MDLACSKCGRSLVRKHLTGRLPKYCDSCREAKAREAGKSLRESNRMAKSPPANCCECGSQLSHANRRGPKITRCSDCWAAHQLRLRRASYARRRGCHERSCLQCGGRFKTKRPQQKYCSPTCAHLSERKRCIVPCETCGSPLESLSSRPRKYCSQKCFRLGNHRPPPVCLNCGKPFKRKHYKNEWQGKNKYCSRGCYYDKRWGKDRPQNKSGAARVLRASRRARGLGLKARCKKFGVPFDPLCTREAVCERDGWTCRQCGTKCHVGPCRFNRKTRKASPRNAHHDHIVPVSRRDPSKGNTFDNSQCLCGRCNQIKGKRGGYQMLLPLGWLHPDRPIKFAATPTKG
jgi:hypothetical protein